MRRLPADILIYERFQRMIKIMFVCHGNICRSPMAEFVMKERVRQSGLDAAVYVESAATFTTERKKSSIGTAFPTSIVQRAWQRPPTTISSTILWAWIATTCAT